LGSEHAPKPYPRTRSLRGGSGIAVTIAPMLRVPVGCVGQPDETGL